jgi:hypothetical protein
MRIQAVGSGSLKETKEKKNKMISKFRINRVLGFEKLNNFLTTTVNNWLEAFVILIR